METSSVCANQGVVGSCDFDDQVENNSNRECLLPNEKSAQERLSGIGRATLNVQDLLKHMGHRNESQAKAKHENIEKMVSFLPKKVLETIKTQNADEEGSGRTSTLTKPFKSDFDGVVVLVDLVQSTVLSEEVESNTIHVPRGRLKTINEQSEGENRGEVDVDPTAVKRNSIFVGEGSESSHSRDQIASKTIEQQVNKSRDAQTEKGKLGAERYSSILTRYFRKLVGIAMKVSDETISCVFAYLLHLSSHVSIHLSLITPHTKRPPNVIPLARSEWRGRPEDCR